MTAKRETGVVVNEERGDLARSHILEVPEEDFREVVTREI